MKKANEKGKTTLGSAQDSPRKPRGGESKKLTRGRAESLAANPAAAENPAKSRAAKRNPNTATPRHAKSQESAQNTSHAAAKSPQNAAITARLKAFLTDIFMIYAPILYVATYVVLGSKEAFLDNEMAHFACFALFGVASSLFFAKTGQTPGYKYAQIALFNERGERVGFALALIRFIVFCASMSLAFGLFVPFLRRDKRAFHDILCRTRVVKCVNS